MVAQWKTVLMVNEAERKAVATKLAQVAMLVEAIG